MINLFHRAKANRELDLLAEKIASNVANNYKDAAQDYLRQYENRLEELKAEGKLNQRQTEHYGGLLSDFKGKMKEFPIKIRSHIGRERDSLRGRRADFSLWSCL